MNEKYVEPLTRNIEAIRTCLHTIDVCRKSVERGAKNLPYSEIDRMVDQIFQRAVSIKQIFQQYREEKRATQAH